MNLFSRSLSPRSSSRIGSTIIGCAGLYLLLSAFSAHAGSFKRVTIDGNFDDWTGVPMALDDVEDGEGIFDFKDIFIANDEEFVYARVRLHSPANYAAFHHQVVVDGDGDSFTGLSWLGLGSEMMIEDGAGYQQKNGQFNEGQVSQLAWDNAPLGNITQFELRFSRETIDTDAENIFSGTDIVLSFVSRDLNWEITDTVEGIPYELAETPDRFEGTAAVIELLNAAWNYQENGDPAPDWTQPEFSPDDSWKRGEGFLGAGLPDGVYPTVNVPLTAGRTAYYLRTSFDWEFDTDGASFLADVYLSDGAVIYLNGVEVRRVRMPDGPITDDTPATGETGSPGVLETLNLPSGALTTGLNHLAVEIHQATGSEADLAFGLILRVTDSDPPSQLDASQPEDRTVTEGQGTILTPGALAGTGPFTFQWYKDEEPIDDANSAMLEIPTVFVNDAGAYYVEISNAAGSIRSRNATLTTVAEPVALTDDAQPLDRDVVEGESTTFSVEITGSPLLAYQWHKDGEPIGGASDAAYTIDAVLPADAGTYHVTVTNRVNSVSSRMAQLTVLSDAEAPVIESVTGSAGKIVIRFDEPVDAATALEPTNYALPDIEITSTELSEDGRTVTLTTGSFSFGETIPFRVNGVADAFGNVVNVSAPFRASILIDGDFADWEGITPATSDPEETGEGEELKEYWVTNDSEYLYLRFSFHGEIGPLPTSHFYHIYIDADNDPATGFNVSGIGSEMMIENGGGYLQRSGGFNEGGVGNTGFLLAPESPSTEFECRISLGSLVNADQSPIFTGDTVAVAFALIDTAWTAIDRGPVEEIIAHTLIEWLPPTPPPAFSITSLAYDQGTDAVTVSWNADEDGLYSIETSTNLNNWLEIDDGIPSEGMVEMSATFNVPADTTVLYVRVLGGTDE